MAGENNLDFKSRELREGDSYTIGAIYSKNGFKHVDVKVTTEGRELDMTFAWELNIREMQDGRSKREWRVVRKDNNGKVHTDLHAVIRQEVKRMFRN